MYKTYECIIIFIVRQMTKTRLINMLQYLFSLIFQILIVIHSAVSEKYLWKINAKNITKFDGDK